MFLVHLIKVYDKEIIWNNFINLSINNSVNFQSYVNIAIEQKYWYRLGFCIPNTSCSECPWTIKIHCCQTFVYFAFFLQPLFVWYSAIPLSFADCLRTRLKLRGVWENLIPKVGINPKITLGESERELWRVIFAKNSSKLHSIWISSELCHTFMNWIFVLFQNWSIFFFLGEKWIAKVLHPPLQPRVHKTKETSACKNGPIIFRYPFSAPLCCLIYPRGKRRKIYILREKKENKIGKLFHVQYDVRRIFWTYYVA